MLGSQVEGLPYQFVKLLSGILMCVTTIHQLYRRTDR